MLLAFIVSRLIIIDSRHLASVQTCLHTSVSFIRETHAINSAGVTGINEVAIDVLTGSPKIQGDVAHHHILKNNFANPIRPLEIHSEAKIAITHPLRGDHFPTVAVPFVCLEGASLNANYRTMKCSVVSAFFARVVWTVCYRSLM